MLMILILVFIVVIVFALSAAAVVAVVLKEWQATSRKIMELPGPPPTAILGHMPLIVKMGSLYEACRTFGKEYGDFCLAMSNGQIGYYI